MWMSVRAYVSRVKENVHVHEGIRRNVISVEKDAARLDGV